MTIFCGRLIQPKNLGGEWDFERGIIEFVASKFYLHRGFFERTVFLKLGAKTTCIYPRSMRLGFREKSRNTHKTPHSIFRRVIPETMTFFFIGISAIAYESRPFIPDGVREEQCDTGATRKIPGLRCEYGVHG